MNNLKKIIANNIINLRKEEKLTQLVLANELHYSDKTISKWERAESIPDIVVLKNVADFFRCYSWLFIKWTFRKYKSSFRAWK